MNARLYDLADAWRALLLAGVDEQIDPDTGEVTTGDWDAALERLEGDIDAKIDGCCKVLQELDGSAATLKAEGQRLAKRRKSVELNIARLREYVRQCLVAGELPRVKTPFFTASQTKAKKSVEVLHPEKLPPEMRTLVVTVGPDLHMQSPSLDRFVALIELAVVALDQGARAAAVSYVPDRAAIKKPLMKKGGKVAGAVLVTGEPGLTIR